MVTAVTKIGNSTLKSKGSSNSFEINYVIKIPKNGTVKSTNKYGNITTLNLELNYGYQLQIRKSDSWQIK